MGADANELQVRDRTQAGENFIEALVGKKQGITAGKQDITDFRMLLEVFEC